jgi:hypothetical protein
MEAVEFDVFAHNGIIEIPIEYREDYSTDVRVILMRDQEGNREPLVRRPQAGSVEVQSSQNITEHDIQERIAAAERLVGIASQNAMTLEEIRKERLARQ